MSDPRDGKIEIYLVGITNTGIERVIFHTFVSTIDDLPKIVKEWSLVDPSIVRVNVDIALVPGKPVV